MDTNGLDLKPLVERLSELTTISQPLPIDQSALRDAMNRIVKIQNAIPDALTYQNLLKKDRFDKLGETNRDILAATLDQNDLLQQQLDMMQADLDDALRREKEANDRADVAEGRERSAKRLNIFLAVVAVAALVIPILQFFLG